MLAAQAAFEAEHGPLKPSDKIKPDSLDSSDGFSVGNGDDKVVEAVTQPQLNQPVRPLPPFSPNFGRSSMQIANGEESSIEDAMKVESEVNGTTGMKCAFND